MSPLFAKFACFNFAVTLSSFNLLNSGVVIYLLWSSISFSRAVRGVIVATLEILGISILTSFILVLSEALATKLEILGISFLASFILS